jgi:hypothetical protein
MFEKTANFLRGDDRPQKLQNMALRGYLRRNIKTEYVYETPTNDVVSCDTSKLESCLINHKQDTKNKILNPQCKEVMELFKKSCGLRRVMRVTNVQGRRDNLSIYTYI